MKVVVPLLSLGLLTLPAGAASDNDCSGAPADAVLDLPAPVDQWLTLECTRYGHALIRRDNANWVNMRSNTFGGLFTAQRARHPGDKAQEGRHDHYFTALEAVKLDETTARPEERQLLGHSADIWRFVASTNLGSPIRFYFVRRTGENEMLAFVLCEPGCGGDFLIAFKR